MELIFILMSTAVGTIVGSIAGVFTAQRVNRSHSPEAASLKMQLQASERSLAEIRANLEELRKQVGERDQQLKAAEEGRTRAQQSQQQAEARLEQLLAEGMKGGVSPAEDSGNPDLAMGAAALSEQCTALEARLAEERNRMSDEAARQIAMLESELARRPQENELTAERQRVQELSETVTSLKAELTAMATAESDLKQRLAVELSERLGVEGDLAAERRQVQELHQSIASLMAERATLENELGALRLRCEELTEQIAHLTAHLVDRSAMENELVAERQRARELADRIDGMSAEVTEATQLREKAMADYYAEREQAGELRKQVAAMEERVAQLDVKLREERQSAAKGMALLAVAQDNLSRVFSALAIEGPNGNGQGPNGHGHNGAAGGPVSAETVAAATTLAGEP
jgi:chromosome segregation ATPase